MAGETVFSLETISLETDGTCRVRAYVGVVAEKEERPRLRPQRLVVALTEAQAAEVASLRASIAATIKTSLADAKETPALTHVQKLEARKAARETREKERDERARARDERARARERGRAAVRGKP